MSTFLLLAVFVSLKRQRDGWAGFFLALGLYKPQLVLPMVGVFLVTRRWNSIAVFSITGIILGTISLLMVGWQGAFDFITILRLMEHYSYIIYPANMPNLRGLSHLLSKAGTLEQILDPLTVTLSLGLYALCLYLWSKDYDELDLSFDLKFSLTLVTTVLVSYHLYAHDVFPLTIPLILLFRYVNFGAVTHRAISKAYFLFLMLVFVPVIPRYLIQYRALSWAALLILFLYAILTLEIYRHNHITLADN